MVSNALTKLKKLNITVFYRLCYILNWNTNVKHFGNNVADARIILVKFQPFRDIALLRSVHFLNIYNSDFQPGSPRDPQTDF